MEYENIIFTVAIILSAVARRFVLTVSWQIIAPALVMSLSTVLSITGSFFRMDLSFCLQQAGFTTGLVPFLVGLAPNVSFAVKLLTMFAKSPFCMLCNTQMNSLFLMSPNTGSFHGKNVGTFGRKLSSFCLLVQKLQPELPNLPLKKHPSWQLTYLPPFHPPPPHLSQRAVFSATCSRKSNSVSATHGRRIPHNCSLCFEHSVNHKGLHQG